MVITRLPFSMQNKDASDQLDWNVLLEHVDNQDLRRDGEQAAAFIQILSSIPSAQIQPDDLIANLSFLPIS